MEEKKSHDPQLDGEEIKEEILEQDGIPAEESEQLASESEEKVEIAESSENESKNPEKETAEELTKEDPVGEEAADESFEEDLNKRSDTTDTNEISESTEGVSDTADTNEISESSKALVEEAAPALAEKDDAVEKTADIPATSKATIGKTVAKWASTGLVIQSWQLVVAAAVVVTMVASGVALGVALGNRNASQNSNFNDSPVDYEWVLPEGGYTNEDQIVLPGYDQLTFPAGKQEIEIVLPNPKGNPCYFRYTLLLEDTGEILYQTTLIPPGKAVLEIKLSRPLPKGDYSLVIGIDSISLADGRTPMNGGEQKILLKVR